MSLLIILVLIVLGLAALVFGAEWLVKGASGLARRFGIPSLVIGLTIVAFGTSAPEFSVNIYAALTGAPDIAIGNVVGSNIVNILIGLGIAAVILPLSVKSSTVRWEIPLALMAAVLLFILGSDRLFDGAATDIITRTDGFALVALFIVFMFYIVALTRYDKDTKESMESAAAVLMPAWKAIGLCVLGLVALVGGGRVLVDQAITLATLIGLSEAVIGLTVVAVGTSLPEIVTSAIAARRGETDIAIGNVVGSNIFNIFLILGVSALIAPLPVALGFTIDALVMIGATLLLFGALFLGKRGHIDRWQGVLFIILYVLYVAYLLV